MENQSPFYLYPTLQEAELVCTCLSVEVPWCVQAYGFPTIYSEQNVVFSFTDKFYKKYYSYVEIDPFGWAVVFKENFPPELFNPYAGEFLVEFWELTDSEKKRMFFFDGEKLYKCLTLKVVDIDARNLSIIAPYYVSLKQFYCCCERLCPPPRPACQPSKIIFSIP